MTPRNVALLGIAVAFISTFTRLDVGSGRFIVGHARVTGCVVSVLCLLTYGVLRLWSDRKDGAVRNFVLGACLLLAVAAFAHSHFSVFADHHRPRLSLRHDYWRSLLICGAVIAFACLFCAVHALWKRGRRKSTRHASGKQ